MASTVVAVFDDQNDAIRAQQDLIAGGFPAASIRITRSDTFKVRDEKEPGFWETLKEEVRLTRRRVTTHDRQRVVLRSEEVEVLRSAPPASASASPAGGPPRPNPSPESARPA